MLLQSLALIIIFVSDLERSLRWYQEKLELPLLSQGGDFARLQVGEAKLALHASANAGQLPQNSGSMPVFQVSDFAAAKSRLEHRGCEFIYEARTTASWFGTIQDPDGNPLQIMQELEGPRSSGRT